MLRVFWPMLCSTSFVNGVCCNRPIAAMYAKMKEVKWNGNEAKIERERENEKAKEEKPKKERNNKLEKIMIVMNTAHQQNKINMCIHERNIKKNTSVQATDINDRGRKTLKWKKTTFFPLYLFAFLRTCTHLSLRLIEEGND